MSSDWQTLTIDELGRVVTGKTPKTSDSLNFGGEIPFVTPTDMDGSKTMSKTARYLSDLGASTVKGSIIPAGAVMVSCIGSDMGKSVIAAHRCVTNQQINSVVVDEQFSSEFVYYNLSMRKAELKHLASGGSTMPILNKSMFSKVKIDLPPRSEQLEIVATLSALDDRITLLRKTNATLEAIAQALFKSWFVDFEPVRAKMEGRTPEGMDDATAVLFPDGFEESELGLVPTGWRVGSIGESITVVDFVANGSFASLKENVTLENTPSYALYLRTTDFNSGYSGDFRYVNKSAYDFLSKSSLDGNEVIISNVGDVGTVFRPPTWLGLPMTLGSNAVALKAREYSAFMYLYFSGAKGQHDIQSIVTGSAQLKFNKTNFRSLLIALPEARVLQRFEIIAGALLSTIDNNFATIKTLATTRDTLLPRLISGQLRVASHMPDLEGIN